MNYYCNRFFKTKEEAKAFTKSKGFGAIYSNEKGSRTRKAYRAEVGIANFQDWAKYPFVVAWNENR